MWNQFLIMLGVMLISALLIGIRLLLIKNSEIRSGCAGKNPVLNDEGVACSFCGSLPEEDCKKEDIE